MLTLVAMLINTSVNDEASAAASEPFETVPTSVTSSSGSWTPEAGELVRDFPLESG